MECAWFAPQHNTWSEVFPAIVESVHGRLGGVKHGSMKAFQRVQKRDVKAHDAEADDADTFNLIAHNSAFTGKLGLHGRYHSEKPNSTRHNH